MRLASLRLRQKPFEPGCATVTVAVVGLMLGVFQAVKPALLPIIGMWTSNLAAVLFISRAVAVIRPSVRKAQERLRIELASNETLYRSLFSRSLADAYRSTVDGRILDCNFAFCQTFEHVARQELIGQSGIIGHFSQADRVAFTDRLHAEKELTNVEQRLQGKGGAQFGLSILRF